MNLNVFAVLHFFLYNNTLSSEELERCEPLKEITKYIANYLDGIIINHDFWAEPRKNPGYAKMILDAITIDVTVWVPRLDDFR